jgi:hypothetical protein
MRLSDFSPAQWLGIGGSETEWKFFEDSEIEETTNSLRALIKIFLDAAPQLLDGIVVPDLKSK